MWSTFTFVVILLLSMEVCRSQDNVQTRIPNQLTECYTNPNIMERDNRLPMNVNMLIELIRKIEDTPGFNQDIRQLAVSLIHRFRMDGIERAPGVTQTQSVLPFSPSGFQFSKHRILLSRLIPGNANTFPNTSLTAIERVSILNLSQLTSCLKLMSFMCF